MSAELTPEQRATIAAQIGEGQLPATSELVESFGLSVAQMRSHEHGREDWFCLNLAAYMGEKVASVLRRLLDAEAEAERLRAELAARPTRPAVLREAATAVDGAFHGEPFLNYPPDFADHLRRMADAAEQADAGKDTPAGGESTHVQCNDCGAVGKVFVADDGLSYLAPSGQIGHAERGDAR